MKRLPALALSAATALAVLTPLPAHADTYTARDSAHDVERYEDPTTNPAPDRTDGDVLASRIVHAKRSVMMSMQMADLTRRNDFAGHVFEVRTNSGLRREITIYAFEGRWGGKTQMTRPNGKPVRCGGLRHTLDYTRHVAALSVPRGCLGNPRWVRVGMGSLAAQGEALYADDALRTGTGESTTLSPRVRR